MNLELLGSYTNFCAIKRLLRLVKINIIPGMYNWTFIPIIFAMDKNELKRITQYKLYKNREINELSSLEAQAQNKDIITPNYNTLRKTKGFPSVTSIWSNSLYSFNQNFLKNIPAVDNIVNKIIKSFFYNKRIS